MNTVEKLLTATEEIWKAYNKHPFILGDVMDSKQMIRCCVIVGGADINN